MLLPLLVIALFLALAGYGLFVLLSVAILRSRMLAVQEQVDKGKLGAKTALNILLDADRYLLTTQVGKFLCSCFIGAMSVLIYIELFPIFSAQQILSDYLNLQSKELSSGVSYQVFDFVSIVALVSVVLLLVVVTTVTLTVVQFSKAIGYSFPERVLIYGGWCLPIFERLFLPFRFTAQLITGIFLSLFSIDKPAERELIFSAQDLEEVIEQSAQAGTIQTSESELLQGALRLSELRVAEILTPRTDLLSVPLDSTFQELVDVFVEGGFSRLLVTGEHLDDVRGIIIAKDLLPYVGKDITGASFNNLIRDVIFIDGELKADQALKQLRSRHSHLGVVIDEHGGVDGIITLEDLIEEVFGDILDETDILEDEVEAYRTRSGDLLVDGGMSLTDLYDDYGIELPEGEYETVAGFVIEKLGKIPNKGDLLSLNGINFKVEGVEDNRILQVRITNDQPHVNS